MDLDNMKEMMGKFFKGCGCLTVGFFILMLILTAIAVMLAISYFVDTFTVRTSNGDQ